MAKMHFHKVLQFSAGMAAISVALAASAANPPSWPTFHGPQRDNIVHETGLLKQWPVGGPKLLWRLSGCGRGYSGVSVAGGLLFTSGDFGEVEKVLAIGLDGKLKWAVPNGRAWKGAQPGARTTPTYNDG